MAAVRGDPEWAGDAALRSPGHTGWPFLRRRISLLIDGAAADARDLSARLVAYLDGGGANSHE